MRIILLFLVAQTALPGQSMPRVAIEPRYRPQPRADLIIDSNLVEVPVAVLNPRGAPVLGLKPADFRLREDGEPQTIRTFTSNDAPVSVGIVVDTSRSMEPRLERARQAVARLFQEANEGDEFHLVEFNDAPRVVCELTANGAALHHALASISAHGWTALFDGVYVSARMMRRARNTRRALVVLSDGEDNFSQRNAPELRSYLREAGVVIYTIGLSAGRFGHHDTRHLRRMSRETGGWYYPVNHVDDLKETVQSIGEAIRSQYVLGYTPSNSAADGKLRRIAVQLADASRYHLSWRTAYYAPVSLAQSR